MDARNRSLAEWFTRIASGQIQLPRFQRFEAWGHREIDDLGAILGSKTSLRVTGGAMARVCWA